MTLPRPDTTIENETCSGRRTTSGHLAHVAAATRAAFSLSRAGNCTTYTGESVGNFHKFRHRASKWLPVQRSDIVDNRHVARGRIFNIAFAPSNPARVPASSGLHRYPPQSPLCVSVTPACPHAPPNGIVPRIVPKVFGEPA